MNQSFTQLRILFFLLIFGVAAPAFAQIYTLETVPNPKQSRSSHYVSNPDHILSNAAVNQIDLVLGQLEDSTTAQVAVVCLNSIGDNVPKDFATALFRKWGLGYKQKNNGLLVLLVKDQHRFEMETGYGFEGILPDAICSRIQTQKMVPLAKVGDFDEAMIAGVKEIAQLISTPEAATEVYDKSKFTYDANQPLDSYGIFVVFLLLIPFLLVLRLFSFFFKKTNPVTDQIEKVVSQKGRFSWAFLLYVVMPIAIGLVVIQLREPLSLHGWHILFILYAYTGVVVWDSRRRRKNAFTKLFGNMTGPERYAYDKAARLNGWGNILLFPIPFGWLRKENDEELNIIRNNARKSAEGYNLSKVDSATKDAFLTDYQKVEQQLNTIDYDVWRNKNYNITQAIGYENLNDKVYQHCPKCDSKAMYLASNRIIKEATTEREGRGANDYECKACGHHKEDQYTIAMVVSKPASSTSSRSSTTYSSSGSSSSSSWGSSSSSSSSSSWGGGSSGGGGAGSSW